ncbi:MAG: hypothetical protein EXS17_06905 [Phycisphaerales bacterium]|nr:hypothetical protein [Phycisphaerales bacterium]
MIEIQCGGDKTVWRWRVERAYLQHREAIVANLVGHHSMAAIEDALQDIFARWLVRIPVSAAIAEVMLQPAYLFTCVRREIAQKSRVERRHQQSTNRAVRRGVISNSSETPRGSDPVHAEEPPLTDAQLVDELARLPAAQLEALRTFAIENVRSRDAARTLGCGESALFVRRFRALERIRLHRQECDAVARIGTSRKDARARGGGGVSVSAAQLGIAS